MNKYICDNCGSNDFCKLNEHFICSFCKTKYTVKSTNTSIDLSEDIEMLLKKMINEPNNAQRYANIILDIDPSNSDIYKYL